MSFHASCENIHLQGGHILVAKARSMNGNWCDSSIDLDHYIGNSDGWFTWDGNNFSHSAKEITLSHRPDGLWLEGDLPCRDGGYRERQGIRLSDRISNVNGRLVSG
ncbi:Cyanovirin-N [Tirmania nivea]|nr:Cyanovirin-N [Tirmania nivea]